MSTRELDRRLFGFIKKVASKFLGRELSEGELDELVAREFEDVDTYVICTFYPFIHEQKLISCSIATRELDRRLFGFIKKVASKFLGRELSEGELDELVARDFEDVDTYVICPFYPRIKADFLQYVDPRTR